MMFQWVDTFSTTLTIVVSGNPNFHALPTASEFGRFLSNIPKSHLLRPQRSPKYITISPIRHWLPLTSAFVEPRMAIAFSPHQAWLVEILESNTLSPGNPLTYVANFLPFLFTVMANKLLHLLQGCKTIKSPSQDIPEIALVSQTPTMFWCYDYLPSGLKVHAEKSR